MISRKFYEYLKNVKGNVSWLKFETSSLWTNKIPKWYPNGVNFRKYLVIFLGLIRFDSNAPPAVANFCFHATIPILEQERLSGAFFSSSSLWNDSMEWAPEKETQSSWLASDQVNDWLLIGTDPSISFSPVFLSLSERHSFFLSISPAFLSLRLPLSRPPFIVDHHSSYHIITVSHESFEHLFRVFTD